MQSILIKLTSVAVMLHMTFGCNWHHGVGTHACTVQCSTITCSHHGHDYISCSHENVDHTRDNKLPLGPISASQDNGRSQRHGHFGCDDDRCKVTQSFKFVYIPCDFSSEYLGGAESIALIHCQARTIINLDRIPDGAHTETAVRAHLLLGVQIL